MDIKQQFDAAVAQSKQLPQKPSNEDLLTLYSLYKQGMEGDITGDRPGGFDFVGIAKYDAWAGQKGKSREDAMKEYVAFVQRLQS